jgi:hypothetical protein
VQKLEHYDLCYGFVLVMDCETMLLICLCYGSYDYALDLYYYVINFY